MYVEQHMTMTMTITMTMASPDSAVHHLSAKSGKIPRLELAQLDNGGAR